VRNTTKALTILDTVKDFKILKEKDLQLNKDDYKYYLPLSIKKRLEYKDLINLVINSEEK
jgi:hypothetical protein